jgi:hypothetical protein
MKLKNYNYKQVLREIIIEEISKYSHLQEIFDSQPFKTQFEFIDLDNSIRCKSFNDPQTNSIQVIFHKMRRECYEVDFMVNGNSYENLDIDYSLSEYTSLISTIFKCIEQFISEFSPAGLDVGGLESNKKIEAGRKGQKNAIYKYALQSIDIPSNYSLLTNADGGVQILKK